MQRRFPSPLLEILVDTAPAATVTQRSPLEVDPRRAGLEHEGVARIWRCAERLYESGLHPALQLCVRKRGHVVIDRAIGHARGNAPRDGELAEKVSATPKTLFNFFSASKAVTAMLIHLLDDRGLLHVGDRIVEYIPEFGRHGKERMTIRHILTHRAGIPLMPLDNLEDSLLDLLDDNERIVDLLCESTPSSVPGRRLAYHALTGGFVLGAIVERVAGRPLRELLRTEILAPLGMSSFNYGVAPDELHRVARNAFTGPPMVPPISTIADRALGLPYKRAVDLSNDPRFLTAVVPSGNIIGTAEEASRFFQLLLQDGEWEGVQIFAPRTIRRAVQEDSFFEADFTIALPVRYGLGFILGARRFSLYGPNTSDAFGHIGFTNIVAWADPAREVSACLMTSGKPLITPRLRHLLRLVRVMSKELS